MAPAEQPALQAQLRDGSLAGSWTLDPARSEVVLHTRHTWGLRPLRGVFGRVSGHGTVTVDGDASGVITVVADSVDTKNPQRDKHLRSADFFDVANHPEFTFAAESVTPADGGVRVGRHPHRSGPDQPGVVRRQGRHRRRRAHTRRRAEGQPGGLRPDLELHWHRGDG